MEFGFSETQEMVRTSARDFLVSKSSLSLARTQLGEKNVEGSNFWSQVAEMGWPGLAIAEEYGGAEMGLMPLAALMEQWGAHLAPGPLFESTVLSAPLIESEGSQLLKREILPGIADGTRSVGIAVLESSTSWSPQAINSVAVEYEEGWAITGQKNFVANGDEADWLLVAARTGEAPKEISLFLVDRKASGISSTPMRQADGSPLYTVRFNETVAASDRVVGQQDEAWPLIQQMVLRGSAFRAVQLAGIGNAVLDATVGYAKERRQFGQPIGSFQAIQHTLADMAVAVRSVRNQAYRAVWSVETDSPNVERDVARASVAASSLIPEICWKAHQSHGAIGFTWEHDLHLFTRHAVSWAAEFGGESNSLDVLANALSL